jgi:hypothetical protein
MLGMVESVSSVSVALRTECWQNRQRAFLTAKTLQRASSAWSATIVVLLLSRPAMLMGVALKNVCLVGIAMLELACGCLSLFSHFGPFAVLSRPSLFTDWPEIARRANQIVTAFHCQRCLAAGHWRRSSSSDA